MALYIGNYDNAIRYLDEAYKSDPMDPLVLYNLSLAYVQKRDFKTALTLIKKCIVANPNYPDANNLKQQILDQLKIIKYILQRFRRPLRISYMKNN